MKALRSLLAAILAIAALSANATDKTDLWWNPAESGWGMTIAHQGDTIFVTMYVYGTDTQPTWFVGTLYLQSTDSQGINTYGGTWYRVTGPYYGALFNPSAVNATQVGTATYRELTVTTGQINYTVNGTPVTKNVQRQTLQNNPSVLGTFGGAYISTVSGCSNSAFNGPVGEVIRLALTGTPAAMTSTVTFTGLGTVCTVNGPYTQAGRMGSLSGPFSCTNGISGTGLIFEIEAGSNAISARFNLSYTGGCSEAGGLAGARLPS